MSTLNRLRWMPALAAALLVGTMSGVAQGQGKESDKKDEASQAELEKKLEAARVRLDEAAREVADLSMSMSENVMPEKGRMVRFGMQRAMLGINVGRGGSVQDEGVEVVSVSPGGPAANAGLKAGDVLLDVNGKALKRTGDESPREQLMMAMRNVKAGDKVAVSYRRDGKAAKADLVAQPLVDRMFTMTRPPHGAVMHFPSFAFMRADGVFGSAELVPLTPKLGQYFGTEKGLLVVRAPADSRLKLEDGDVIVDIDGRTPSSPAHALRILSSYQAGEKLKLNVLRARKRMSFDITIPEEGPWERRLEDATFIDDGEVVIEGPGGVGGVMMPGRPARGVITTLEHAVTLPMTEPLPPPPPLPAPEEPI